MLSSSSVLDEANCIDPDELYTIGSGSGVGLLQEKTVAAINSNRRILNDDFMSLKIS